MTTLRPAETVISKRPFVALAVAETFSITASRMSMIAIPWLVLTTTGSPTITGAVAMTEMLPYVIAKALAGPIIDRIGARRVAVAGDAISVVVVASVPIMSLLGVLAVPTLLPIVALLGVVRGPADGAKTALVPRVAETAAVPLERVTGVTGAIERLAGTIGAAVGGGIVAVIGATSALAVNAAALAASAVIIFFGLIAADRPSSVADEALPDPVSTAPAGGLRTYLADLGEGWRFLRREPVLIGITIMVGVTNLLDQAWSAVLVPVWSRDGGYGAGGVGLMFAVLSGCSILGSVIAAAGAARLPRLPLYVVAFIIVGLPRFVIMAVDAPLLVILVVVGIGGFMSGFLNPILGAVAYERIPKPLVGRVMGIYSALCWSLIPFGGLFGGLLIAGFGLPVTLLITGGGYFAATLIPLVRKSFRDFSRRPDHQPAG